MAQDQDPNQTDRSEASDDQVAREAGAAGGSGISRRTGTAGQGSGVEGSGGERALERHAAQDAGTGPATNESDDLTDAAGPSGSSFGGTGTAGSGLGTASTEGAARPDAAGRGTVSDAAGATDAPGAARDKGTTGGGSDAGGGGR